MPPRDEPTVESELMNFADAPTTESPALKTAEMRDRISSKLPLEGATRRPRCRSTISAWISIIWKRPVASSADSISQLEETDHPADAPTMVAGLDERSRRMMEEAAKNSRDRDLTELERELEASFIADLDAHQEEIKTAVLGPSPRPRC